MGAAILASRDRTDLVFPKKMQSFASYLDELVFETTTDVGECVAHDVE